MISKSHRPQNCWSSSGDRDGVDWLCISVSNTMVGGNGAFRSSFRLLLIGGFKSRNWSLAVVPTLVPISCCVVC